MAYVDKADEKMAKAIGDARRRLKNATAYRWQIHYRARLKALLWARERVWEARGYRDGRKKTSS